ncbi:MAG: YiiD C-terminal domain-containing protein [Pirellulales bacterium]
MVDSTAKLISPAGLTPLEELQATLDREIPMSTQMGIHVHEGGLDGLVMRLPLNPNRNHQQTAFAGSLNALCTIAGWGYVFLLLRQLGRVGNIVIHRSNIKYLQPVTSSEIYAQCRPVTPAETQHFIDMLDDKGQAKLELAVEIAGYETPAVSFKGSYVVLPMGKLTSVRVV